MIEYLDIDDYKFMHLVVPEPFEDAQQWNGKDYQCCFCGRVHRRRSGCQNCVACGEDSSACECDDCRYCNKLPNLCGCRLCRSCGYPEEHTPQTLANPRLMLCYCKFCKHCGKRGHECQCNACLDCSRPGSHCRCMYCPVCKRKVKHCDCETCPLCEVKWERCNCFWHNDRKVKLNHSQLLQAIDTQGLESRYLPEEPRFVETVHIRGASLHDYRIIAVKKMRPYLAHCFSRRLDNIRYRYRQAKGCITGSAVYKLLQPQYKQLAFYFETELYSTHIEVRTSARVKQMVEALARLPRGNGRPTIAFDLEAVNLGRRGTTCYLQVRDLVEAQTYLVDILTLQDKAFLTTSEDGTTLKNILEDPGIIMLIFDGRQDADALYWKHGVQVRGVLDLQTMAMLLREHPSIYRTNYKSTMNQYAGLSSKELRQWNLFKGYPFNGDYTIFKERPLPYRLKLYSIGDVLYLDQLYTNIAKRLTVRGLLLAHEWSRKQVEATWQATWTSSRQYVDAGFNRCWEEQINRTMKPAGPPLAAAPVTDDDTDEEDV